VIAAIFTGAGEAVTGLGALLASSTTAAIALFWTGTALTALGSLAVIGLGVGVVYFVIGLVRGGMKVHA